MNAEAPPATPHAENGLGPPEPLLRQFTALGLWLLVVNGMIGAGIFGLPAEAARLTGAWSPLMFLVCGLLLAPVMLSLGEVASHFRGTGGPILYTRTAFGRLAGFQTGWAFYGARVLAFAANINLLVSSLGWFWDGVDQGATRIWLLLAVCGLLTWINVVGARHAMRAVGALTLLKFLPLLLVAGFGLSRLSVEGRLPAAPPPGAGEVGTAALLLVYAYVGWESALVPAGEAKNPRRQMPLALIWGLVVVTLLYVVVQAVCVAVVPDLAGSERPLVDAGAALFGPAGAALLTAGVVLSVGGNVAASMFSSTRMTYALAVEGNFPGWFGRVHPRYRTPDRSILFFGALCFLLAVAGSFVWLAAMSTLVRILIYLACLAALPVLRRTQPARPGRFRLRWGYAIPALAALFSLWLLFQVEHRSWLALAVFVAAGMLVYFGAVQRLTPEVR